MTSYKDLGYSSYSSYLSGSSWAKTKSKFYNSKFVKRIDNYPVCTVCLSSNKLNVHHKSYKNLGKENLSDLVLLCEECHQKTHEIEKYTRHSLGNAHKKIQTIFKEKPNLSGKAYAKQRLIFLKNKRTNQP